MNNTILEQLLVEKNILTEADLSGGATLNAEQRERLTDLTIDGSRLKDYVTLEKVYDDWDIDTMELTGRFIQLDDGTDANGRNATTGKVSLSPIDVKVVFRAHRTYLRKLANGRIPEEQKAQVLVEGLAKVLANDLEKMTWYSNTVGPSIAEADYYNDGTGHATNRIKDETFSQQNGVIAASDAAGSGVLTYDASNSADIKKILHEMIKQLPADYRADKSELYFYMPSDLEENLRSYLYRKDTPLGDFAFTSDDEITFRGIKIVNCPLLETNPYVTQHITLNGTTGVSLAYDNLPTAGGFYVNLSSLTEATDVAPYVETTDYVITRSTGLLATAGGTLATNAVAKVTYQTLPQVFLTKKSNFVIAISVNDMEMEQQYFANSGNLDLVGRTRAAFKFIKQGWVSRAINIQDAVLATV
jgi:hypothetical protein